MSTRTLIVIIVVVAAAATGLAMHTDRGAEFHHWLRTTIHGR
jgi:hypothetical protein